MENSSSYLVPAAAVSAKDSGGHPLPPGDGSFKPGMCGKGGTPLSDSIYQDPLTELSPPNFEPGVRQVYRRQIYLRSSRSGGSSAGDHGPGLRAERASIAPLLPVTVL